MAIRPALAPPDAAGLSADDDPLRLQHEVEQLLYLEARLLDAWDLDAWLALYTPDARYVVPTTDLPGGDPRSDLVFIDDDRSRMEARVVRLQSRHAHREYPWSRTRRFISNVMVTGVDGDEVEATASVAVWRFRAGDSAPYVGRYDVRLRRVDGCLRLCAKRAVLDHETLSDHGALSIIF